MKTKRVATQNARKFTTASQYMRTWGSALIMSMLLLAVSCTKNDDLETIGDESSIDNEIPAVNKPPLANAGENQAIILPTNFVYLDGSASTDPDNYIIGYSWSKIAGPDNYNFNNANAIQTEVINLVEGEYQFELEVTDTGGLIDRDTVQVTVNKQADVSSVDIYVAGQLNGLPVYWKNSQVVHLSNGAIDETSSSIAVDGNDVYVSGLEWWNGHVVPRYWKNNQEVRLSDTPGLIGISSIAVANGDVYVAGWEWEQYYLAKYWKNGQSVSLPCNSTNAWANSIAIDGDDVYVAGYDGDIAKYWKNGQAVSLNDGSNQAYANDIAVVGNDIYVAGSEWNGHHSVAKYWKNGQAVSLTTGTKNATANSIAVVGNDVYVAGDDGGIVKYWKNGQEVSLTNGTNYAWGGYVAVDGSNVYVAGTEIINGNYIAKYWVNGQAVKLSDRASATSIVVVKRE